MAFHSNNPPILVELTEDQAEFVVANCDSNIAFALSTLDKVNRDTAYEMVDLMERFKALKKAVETARNLS